MSGTTPVLPPVESATGWGQSLYTGAAGIALLHIEQAQAGIGDWDTAHQWVKTMTSQPISAHPGSCGLHHGAPAVAFVLHASGQPAYGSVLDRLDENVTSITRHRLRRAHERINAHRRPALAEYDLIRGLTGIGVYLLRRYGGGEFLRDVLGYLVRLTEPVTRRSVTLPGWWTNNGPGDQPSTSWPGGHANLGMAHGISGPLALLSAAMRCGITVPGQVDAMRVICSWLDDWRAGDGTTAWWPGLVSMKEYDSGTLSRGGPQRPSWCYGTPGLARAQQLAGLALADSARRQVAEQALAGCVADEAQLAQLRDASLCHGWAGAIHAVRCVAADLGDPGSYSLRGLARRLGAFLDRHGQPGEPGLLEGRAGVRLAQHALAADRPSISGWDACLLLDAWPAGSHLTHRNEDHDDKPA